MTHHYLYNHYHHHPLTHCHDQLTHCHRHLKLACQGPLVWWQEEGTR